MVRGLASLGIGVSLAFVGIDVPSGTPRYTFDIPQLFYGISIVVITIGLVAPGEVYYAAPRIHHDPESLKVSSEGIPRLSRKDFRAATPAWLRGAAFGAPFGLIPAGGTEAPP